jgi:hypothetical protein
MITNQGWKAVAVGPNTVRDFPLTLDVSGVILGGYTDSFNTLLLNYTGFEIPFNSSSINVGSNSGITAVSSVLNVLANGTGSGDLSIFSVFNQGDGAVVNADRINLGNLSSPGLGFGNYNLTNGSINAGSIAAWNGSSFNHLDGAVTISDVSLGGANANNIAHYKIANGSLAAGTIEMQRGDFTQSGGSVSAPLYLGAATYTLSAGTLHLPGITIPYVHYGPQNPGGFLPYNATLLQTGGTNFCDGPLIAYHEYGAPGVPVAGIGPGRYILSNGVLNVSSTVRSWTGGGFAQWGGSHTNASTEVRGEIYPGWEIRAGHYVLGGGTLVTPSISIRLGDFSQSDGINQVSGEVAVGTAGSPAQFNLSGGLLTDNTAVVDATNPSTPGRLPATFTQTGGTHVITNLLRLIGPPPGFYQPPFNNAAGYSLSAGILNAPNIQIDNGASFTHNGGTLTTSGLLNLGTQASWNENTAGQQFGQLLLSARAGSNASLSLPANNCVVRFANSSSVVWSNQALLYIDNWNGSSAGNGKHQFYFGSNSSGLTQLQLSQIKFRNPAGTTGTIAARTLSTGEIVPDRFLTVNRAADHLVIEWGSGTLQSATNVTGPYEDVNVATSPYSAPFTGPQRFFRIRN